MAFSVLLFFYFHLLYIVFLGTTKRTIHRRWSCKTKNLVSCGRGFSVRITIAFCASSLVLVPNCGMRLVHLAALDIEISQLGVETNRKGNDLNIIAKALYQFRIVFLSLWVVYSWLLSYMDSHQQKRRFAQNRLQFWFGLKPDGPFFLASFLYIVFWGTVSLVYCGELQLRAFKPLLGPLYSPRKSPI